MENTQPMKTESGPVSPEDTLAASTKSKLVAVTAKEESTNSPGNTTATMPNGSKKIWTSAELAELGSKAGLVAGALADFQDAKGKISRREITYTAPSGRVCRAIKLILLVEDVDLVAEPTADGLEFRLVAEESK